jgi:hypothetical protein
MNDAHRLDSARIGFFFLSLGERTEVRVLFS